MSATADSNAEGADPTVERLYPMLRSQILTGELAPGRALSQVQLAKTLDVGRTPLREALRMLQREGLVRAEFNRQIRVAHLSTSDLEQIYARRVVLEALAIRVGIVHFVARELQRLWELVDEMDAFLPRPAERITEWERPHREFHELLVSHAGSEMMEELRRLREHSERYRAILGKDLPTSFPLGAREHRQIVEACEKREKAIAGWRLAEHLARSGITLITQTDPVHDCVALRESLLIVQPSAPSGA